jgi:hypothetical protein
LKNSSVYIQEHDGRYFIKPKYIIDEILKMKMDANQLGEGKYKIRYDTIKQMLIGQLWFKDYSKIPITINKESMRVFEIVEKRLIEILKQEDTASSDDSESGKSSFKRININARGEADV